MRVPESVTFELYAVHLLLCSPHPLSRAWTNCDDKDVRAVSEEALNALPLSDNARAAALELMVALKGRRAFFKGIADTLRESLYAGDEPHPPDGNTVTLIQKMQEIDASSKRAKA